MLSSGLDLVVGAIKEARIDTAKGNKGEEIDLCNILLKVIKEWKTKGRTWVFKHYWQTNPDPEISNWRNECEVNLDG